MKVIHKYPLEITDRQMLLMKRGARVLHVDWQGFEHRQLSLWAEVDPDLAADDTEARVFLVVGTGNPFSRGIGTTFVGTVLQFGGSLVWHVYEEVVAT